MVKKNEFRKFYELSSYKKRIFKFKRSTSGRIYECLGKLFLSHLSTTEKEDDIYILFHKYLETIPNHDQAGEEIIHYLLSFFSILQEKKIKWQKKENFENAFWFYSNNGECIESLNTNNLVDYSKTFNLVLCTLLDLQNKREEGIQR